MNEIVLEHLEKSFGDHKVLLDVNLTVNKGEVISVIGSSGSGKSTLTRLIQRLIPMQEGHIRLDGTDLQSMDMHHLRQSPGALYQPVKSGFHGGFLLFLREL